MRILLRFISKFLEPNGNFFSVKGHAEVSFILFIKGTH